MATRLYFSSTAIPVVTPSAISAEWEHQSGVYTPLLRAITAAADGSIIVPRGANYDTADHLVEADGLVMQYVSAPLAAQTISAQTVQLQFRCLEQRATNNLRLAWKLFLITPAGGVRAGGTIVAFRRGAVEWTVGVGTNSGDSATSSVVTVTAGDRLYLELGFGNAALGAPTASASVDGHNGTIYIGANGPSDLPINNTTQTALNPWLEFTSATPVTFDTGALLPTRLTQDAVEILYSEAIQPTRLTQDAIEVLYAEPPVVLLPTRLTQDAIELLYSEPPPPLPDPTRLTQDALELLYAEPSAPTRLTQDTLEILVFDAAKETRLSQDSVEVLWSDIQNLIPETRITQDAIELLYAVPPPPPAPTVTAPPEGQITTTRMVAGQIGGVRFEAGQITTTRTDKGQAGFG